MATDGFDLIQTELSVTYEEVEAEDRTCRQAELVVDTNCVQGCGEATEESSSGT